MRPAESCTWQLAQFAITVALRIGYPGVVSRVACALAGVAMHGSARHARTSAGRAAIISSAAWGPPRPGERAEGRRQLVPRANALSSVLEHSLAEQ